MECYIGRKYRHIRSVCYEGKEREQGDCGRDQRLDHPRSLLP